MNIFIKTWSNIKGWLLKMLSPKTIQTAIGVQPIITPEQLSDIQIWSDYYNGAALHNTRQKNPVPSLMIAKTICGEVSRNVVDEMESVIQGNDWLDKQWQPIIANWRDATEKAAALGEIILRPFVYKDKILINIANRTAYLPVRYSVDRIMEAVVFVEHQTVGNDSYTLLTYCNWIDGTYTVTNTAYKSDASNDNTGIASPLGKPVPLTDIEAWKNLEPSSVFYNTSYPWFVCYAAPNGESVFADALDHIIDADEQNARIKWDNKAKEPAVFASADNFRDTGHKDSLNPEKSTTKIELPEGKERLYIAGGYSSGEQGITIYSPATNNEDLHFRLEKIKRQIEIICGLSFGILSEPSQVERTATEVKHGRQRMFVTVNAYQKASQTALEQLAIVMSEIASAYGFDGAYSEVTFQWGDSILVTQEERQEAFDKNMVQLQSLQSAEVVGADFVLAYALEYSDTFYTITDEMIAEARKRLPDTSGDDE